MRRRRAPRASWRYACSKASRPTQYMRTKGRRMHSCMHPRSAVCPARMHARTHAHRAWGQVPRALFGLGTPAELTKDGAKRQVANACAGILARRALAHMHVCTYTRTHGHVRLQRSGCTHRGPCPRDERPQTCCGQRQAGHARASSPKKKVSKHANNERPGRTPRSKR